MIRKTLLITTLFILSPALALETPKCSFGSTPLVTRVKTFPGGEITFPWSLFNYYGNMITNVNVTIPEISWEVSLKPGSTIFLNPNSSSSNSHVRHPLTGVEVPSEEVFVTLKVPESEAVNISRRIILVANAYCNLASGEIIPGIQGELEINVEVVSENEYYKDFGGQDAYTSILIFVIALILITAILFAKSKINNRRSTK